MFIESAKIFEKTNAHNNRSIEKFANKIVLLKPINNKKQIVKKNTDEFKCEGDTQTSDVRETKNETEDDDDDDGGFNDNGDDGDV